MAFRYHGRSYADEAQTDSHTSVGHRNVLSRIDNILNFIQSEDLVDMMKSQGSETDKSSHICMSRSTTKAFPEQKYRYDCGKKQADRRSLFCKHCFICCSSGY